MKYNDSVFEKKLDIKRLIHRFLGIKLIFVITALVFLTVAYFLNKKSEPVYKNYSTILIKEKTGSNPLAGSKGLVGDLSFLSDPYNTETTAELIRSYNLVKQTVSRLPFEVSYYKKTGVLPLNLFSDLPFFQSKTELYENPPFKVIFDKSHVQPVYFNFDIEVLNQEKFRITGQGEEVLVYNYIDGKVLYEVPSLMVNEVYRFNETIETEHYKFKIELTEHFNAKGESNGLMFYFNHIDVLASTYLNNLSASPSSQLSMILHLAITGKNYEKISDFLEQLNYNFLNNDLQKKNDAALNTIDFIDQQISSVTDSLSTAESNLKNFRSSNQVMDLSFQGQKVFEQLSMLEDERATVLTQKRYYEYLKEYMNKNENISNLMAPSAMNVVDPVLNELIKKIVELNSRLSEISVGSKNVYRQEIEGQLENVKSTILENVNNNLSNIEINLNELEYRINSLSSKISQMPSTELKLMGIQRKFDLNNEIYTFLLQKRFEAEITRASNSPDYEIVDGPRTLNPGPVAPKKKLNYIIALFLAFILPIGGVLAYDFFNNKITSQEELENLDIPLIGHVLLNNHKTNTVVRDYPQSTVTESLRNVKTNLDFFTSDKPIQVISFTSSLSGDGKSFCSLNLANILANNNQRVVILEYDLRRPNLHKYLNIRNTVGLSSYLSNQAMLEDVIIPTNIENLDIICAGTLPPNPSELISSALTAELFDTLKSTYDFVIIDTAPVGIVSETFKLMSYADLNVFVVRQNHTLKNALLHTIKNFKTNKVENVVTLFNGVLSNKGEYSYKYTSSYYTGEDISKKPGLMQKIFKRNS